MQYAKWIANELNCNYTAVETCDFNSLENFDNIIFGGWLRGSGIVGFDKLKKHLTSETAKKTVVFAVGISGNSEENKKQIWEINFNKKVITREIPLFILPGRYNKDKVKGLDAFMMKIAKKVLISGSIDEQETDKMKEILENGIDMVDRKNITEIINFLKYK